MDPSCVACPNLACPDKGAVGGGTIRVPERTGRRGRPRLVWPEGFALAQVVKAGLHRGEGIVRRVVVGTEATVAAALAASHGGTAINTAYIERLNATLRERLAPLVRRRHAPAHGTALVEDGLHLLRLPHHPPSLWG
jgi:hypothetical protein